MADNKVFEVNPKLTPFSIFSYTIKLSVMLK
jgi:hypothetical protein